MVQIHLFYLVAILLPEWKKQGCCCQLVNVAPFIVFIFATLMNEYVINHYRYLLKCSSTQTTNLSFVMQIVMSILPHCMNMSSFITDTF